MAVMGHKWDRDCRSRNGQMQVDPDLRVMVGKFVTREPQILWRLQEGLFAIGKLLISTVVVNITSQATQQTFSCVWQSQGHETSNVTIIGPPSGVFPFPLDPGPTWYQCDTHSLNENANHTHNYEVETLVRLISAEEKVLVNQTWYCDDEGPATP